MKYLKIKILYLDYLKTGYKEKINILKKDPKLKKINLDESKKYYSSLNCNFKTIFCKDYPEELKLLSSPPLVLYYIGNIQLINKSKISIIGSRNNTTYGKMALDKIIKNINTQNVIVSGYAKGIDQYAHFNAINNGNGTIAVLGSGFNNIYPTNPQLEKQIKDKHLFISEYPPNTKAKPWMFVMRNRIIAALGEKLLVIEANENSGSLITVESALEMNKDIYALPGSIFSKQSRGTNLLLEEGANVLTLKQTF